MLIVLDKMGPRRGWMFRSIRETILVNYTEAGKYPRTEYPKWITVPTGTTLLASGSDET